MLMLGDDLFTGDEITHKRTKYAWLFHGISSECIGQLRNVFPNIRRNRIQIQYYDHIHELLLRRNSRGITVKNMHSEKHCDENRCVVAVFEFSISAIKGMHCFKLCTVFE